MEQLTNAILFYGFLIDEDEDDLNWELKNNDMDTQGFIAKKYGLNELNIPLNDDNLSIFQDYWKQKQELLKTISVDISSHCSCDHPMYYVYIKSSEIIAHRGYPKSVTSLKIGKDWNDKLREFCDKTEIELKEIGWYLVSDWC